MQEKEEVVTEIFDNYHETQREIFVTESRKVRNKILVLALVIFISDLIGLAVLDAIQAETLLYIAVVPLIFVALAFVALKEPMVAIIVAAVIIVGVWVFIIIQTGAAAVVTGWLVKILIISLILTGVQSAREAQRVKKELKL